MEKTHEQIASLYDTFLGRFKFFRKFITILWHLTSEIADLRKQEIVLQEQVGDLKFAFTEQKKWNEELLVVIKETKETIKAPTPPQPDFRTATQIMEERFRTYNEEANKTTA